MGVKRIVVHCVEVEDKPGSLQKFLSDIASAGVDLLCLEACATGGGKGCACLGAKDSDALGSCLKDLDISATEGAGFVVIDEDKMGAASEVLRSIAEAGINCVSGAAIVFDGQYGMLAVVKAADGDAAAAALGV